MVLIAASGKAFWIRCIIKKIFSTIAVPVIWLTDSHTLYHAVKSSNQIADERLSIDSAIIKEKCENKEIENIIWISKENQIADSLIKKVLVVKSRFRLFLPFFLEMSDAFVFRLKKGSYMIMFVSRKKKDITLCFKTNLKTLD